MEKRKYPAIAFLTLMILFFFQNCAAPALPSTAMTFKSDNPQGLLFGSITFPKEKARFNGYFIRITGMDADTKTAKKNSTEIHISPEQIVRMKHDGQLENGMTYLFAIERPEGKYTTPSIRLFTNSGIAALQRTSYAAGFSIPFDVKKGEITYIGNIIFDEYAKEGDTAISLKNSFERDAAKMKELQPGVNWGDAKNDPDRKVDYNSNIKLKL